MIVVEDWTNGPSSNFTLQLGPPPGAQTGPPDGTVTPAGPFCISAPPVQMNAVDMGGNWSGPGTSSGGTFNPATAGVADPRRLHRAGSRADDFHLAPGLPGETPADHHLAPGLPGETPADHL